MNPGEERGVRGAHAPELRVRGGVIGFGGELRKRRVHCRAVREVVDRADECLRVTFRGRGKREHSGSRAAGSGRCPVLAIGVAWPFHRDRGGRAAPCDPECQRGGAGIGCDCAFPLEIAAVQRDRRVPRGDRGAGAVVGFRGRQAPRALKAASCFLRGDDAERSVRRDRRHECRVVAIREGSRRGD